MAPGVFDEQDGASRVYRQPTDEASRHRARMALVACPVGAIGSETKFDPTVTIAAFPDPIADNVFHCGYHAESSYGATSYFIRRDAGNVLVDSPRFARPLINRLEAMGGVDIMYLTHRDDIADHEKFAAHFGCQRIIHADDAVGGLRDVAELVTGEMTFELDHDLTIIPVPGHTRGSTCLLYRNQFLFTGDHLWWNVDAETLRAGRSVCWYDWQRQTESMARLTEHRFEWILPGHGRRRHLPHAQMAHHLDDCITWMRRQ